MMKKILVAGLLGATTLTALTPALAQENEGRGRWNRSHDSQTTQQPLSDRLQNRREASEAYRNQWRNRGEATTQRAIPAPTPGVAVGEPNPNRNRDSNWDDRRSEVQRDRNRDWRSARAEERADWQNNRTNDWRDNRNWRRDGRDFRDDHRSWNRDWRNDRRYDWQGWRHHNGNRFRAGHYYAPRGWSYGYRPFSIGIYLNNSLFSRNYWIDDPYDYRLPPAYGALRWVRYYDDALLVDVRNGYVVDVIRDFFW